MIVYDLQCLTGGHRFEGWFGSSNDYASQLERGLLCCPECGSVDVGKAVMAPSLGRKGNQLAITKPVKPQPMASGQLPPEAVNMMEALAKMQGEALKQSRWVGENFAEQSRAMHYGEKDQETIHGQATLAEAKDLFEEGIAVMPLPFPVAPPDETN
jgi:hypothetical protein